ncbi:hypothetical protein FACS1894145_0740 [Bacteroidia bacterium]|nr:hypothetical protein FACS1894145_0740 [Bacteroidia bacterium]
MDLIEIKMSETLSTSHISNIKTLRTLFPKTKDYVIYSGEQEPIYHHVQFVNWQHINSFFNSAR